MTTLPGKRPSASTAIVRGGRPRVNSRARNNRCAWTLRGRAVAAVRLGRLVAAVVKEPLGARVDDALPVREGCLAELGVRPRLVAEIAVGVGAAHEQRGFAELGRRRPGGDHLDEEQEARLGAVIDG